MRDNLNVLFGQCHTGYDHNFARIGHTFYMVTDKWCYEDVRPQPSNVLPASQFKGKYDVAVGGVAPYWPDMLKPKCPLVVNQLNDGEGFYQDIEDSVARIVFLCKETADKWPLRKPEKAVIIGYGLDPANYQPYIGDGRSVLCLGIDLPKRLDKLANSVDAITRAVQVDTFGRGNEGLISWRGIEKNYTRFQRLVRDYKVYLNPSYIINICTVEMMAIGAPVITYRPVNLKDLIVDGVNGFIVDTDDQAIKLIKHLIENESLRREVGQRARETVLSRFSFVSYKNSWNELLNSVVKN